MTIFLLALLFGVNNSLLPPPHPLDPNQPYPTRYPTDLPTDMPTIDPTVTDLPTIDPTVDPTPQIPAVDLMTTPNPAVAEPTDAIQPPVPVVITPPIIEYDLYQAEESDLNLLNTGSFVEHTHVSIRKQIESGYVKLNSFDGSDDGTCHKLCFDGRVPVSECIQIPYSIDASDEPYLSFELIMEHTENPDGDEYIMSQGALDRSIKISSFDRNPPRDPAALIDLGGLFANDRAEPMHVVAVWDGGIGGKASLYVNGRLEYTNDILWESKSYVENSWEYGSFCLGQNPMFEDDHWVGCMHLVRVYDYALNEEEVHQLMVDAQAKIDGCLYWP